MRPKAQNAEPLPRPQLLEKAVELDAYLKTFSPKLLAQVMGISSALASKTHALIADWTAESQHQRAAIDSFLGDIYSGIQINEWSDDDREYANMHLRILSGLYGTLKPLDGICPYRLEMGYRLPKPPFANLYSYWGNSIAASLPATGPIINLAAVEYSKTITPFVDPARIITPVFRTLSPKTGKPEFVTVHAKIARGAFARWLITNRVENVEALPGFGSIGYRFDPKLSTPESPVFVARTFGGIGLSMRLT
jgi:cytoplasmic iron level regulating protein YaaA (DUF328/UPF0246 family)